MNLIYPILCVCALIVAAYSFDLTIGSSINNRLVVNEKVTAVSIPFKKRVKEFFWADPNGAESIKGIIARDMLHSEANATVTAGGVGYTYCNLKLKSERGEGLDFEILVFI